MNFMPDGVNNQDKAALRGEPSYVWRAGQERRLEMILEAGGDLFQNGAVLENGCGVGIYVEHLARYSLEVVGLEFDLERAVQALQRVKSLSNASIINGKGEQLPFSGGKFDLILSHEVIEHVQDDRLAAREMARCLRPGGRIVLFAPNRGYPFETHGIFWRGNYRFGNIPLVNYLPGKIRDRLAPHVRVYSSRDLLELWEGLDVQVVEKRVIFGAYDNIIARHPRFGSLLRSVMQWLEGTPLQVFGLSHFLVMEKPSR
jgi:SAM-dependent methyltransferase